VLYPAVKRRDTASRARFAARGARSHRGPPYAGWRRTWGPRRLRLAGLMGIASHSTLRGGCGLGIGIAPSSGWHRPSQDTRERRHATSLRGLGDSEPCSVRTEPMVITKQSASSLLSETVTRSRGARLRRWARLSSRSEAQEPRAVQGQRANCKVMPKAPRRPAAPMRRRPPRRSMCAGATLAHRRRRAPRRQAVERAHKEETATRVSSSSRSSSQSLPTWGVSRGITRRRQQRAQPA